jgi:hypothetical protein
MKKSAYLIIFLALFSVYSFYSVSALNQPESIDLLDKYYSAFAEKDVDKYLGTQFLFHLDENQLADKKEKVNTILKNVDVLSYTIDSFRIVGNEKDIYVASYVVNAKIGQIVDGKPQVLEYKKPMIALLTTIGDTPMIMRVMPAEMYDLQLSISESTGLTSGYTIEETKKSITTNIFNGIKGMFSKVKEMIAPMPSTCGNLKCDDKETKSNCAQDCRTLTYNPKCGDGVCSEEESSNSCPYDCTKIIPVNETKIETPKEENKTELKEENKTLIICGDKICNSQLNETCSSCPTDCGCTTGDCIKNKCVVEETENCTSKESYKCYNDDVWYYDSCNVKETKKESCSNGCTGTTCNPVEITPNTTTTTFRSGSAILPSFNGGPEGSYETIPYSTFDFIRGRTYDLAESNDNAVSMLFGKSGDLGTACNGYDCPILKKETSLTFDNMNSHPGEEGSDPHAYPSVGDRYWVLMLEDNSRYGKIEIIELQGTAGSYSGIKFNWAFYP